jgi:hypothetical protein
MPNQQTDHLFQLIKSLTKSEKRNFKLYANRIHSSDEIKFIQLFDVLDKQREFDEEVVLKKVPAIKRSQLSNLKAHLYKQLLTSLRLNHISHYADIEIRENIDYARVLYNKGLYKQSLKLLDKTKLLAVETKQNVLIMEIIEFEKLIESQYITRSIDNRAEELTWQSELYGNMIVNTNQLSNLALRLYGLYLKVGYIRTEKDFFMVKEFFSTNLPAYIYEDLSFYEKLYLYQSYVWYNYIIQDFLMCYKYAQKWVDLFQESPEMKRTQTDLYVKGLHNLLAALFNIRHYSKFVTVLNELEEVAAHKRDYNENTRVLLFLYLNTNRINKHFLEGSFSDGIELVKGIEEKIDVPYSKIDKHRLLVFHYKIACMYFGSGDNKSAIRHLNKVINSKDVGIREDIHCFARILNLIAHFEMGNDDLVDYQIRSVYRFLIKMDDLHLVQQEILNFLRKLSKIYEHELKEEFIKLKDRLVKLLDEPFEKRPFLYLDIIGWLECKIEGRPVQDVIRNKFLAETAD